MAKNEMSASFKSPNTENMNCKAAKLAKTPDTLRLCVCVYVCAAYFQFLICTRFNVSWAYVYCVAARIHTPTLPLCVCVSVHVCMPHTHVLVPLSVVNRCSLSAANSVPLCFLNRLKLNIHSFIHSNWNCTNLINEWNNWISFISMLTWKQSSF